MMVSLPKRSPIVAVLLSAALLLAAVPLACSPSDPSAGSADKTGPEPAPDLPMVELPRYELDPGQVITWDYDMKVILGEDTLLVDGQTAATVLEEIQPGKWDMFVQLDERIRREADENANTLDQKTSQLIRFELSDDGTIANVEPRYTGVDPRELFAPLPPNVDAYSKGWTSDSGVPGATYHCQRAVPGGDPEKVFAIRHQREQPGTDIYKLARETVIEFDLERGLPTTYRWTQTFGWGPRRENHTSGAFTSSEMLPPEEHATRAADVKKFFASLKKIEESERQWDKLTPDQYGTQIDRDAIEASAEALKQEIEPVVASIEDATLKTQLGGYLTNADDRWRYRANLAQYRADRLGKPAPAWSSEDFDGNPRALTDYRGKVVIMDFWYRGCAYCVSAMPALNAVHERYKDRDVVILGVNIDDNPEDAKVVIEEMPLLYPSIKDNGIFDAYAVPYVPATYVIDREGILRDVHLGTEQDMVTFLSAKIDEHLAPDTDAGERVSL